MPKPRSLQDPQPMLNDYAAGIRLRDLAAKYGVCDTTIQKYLRESGVPRRDPWRPKRQRSRTQYLQQAMGKYGLTKETFMALYRVQKGRCAICGIRIRIRNNGSRGNLHIDHDHTTRVVRGLLCPDCNHGLGKFKDSRRLLLAACRYLG